MGMFVALIERLGMLQVNRMLIYTAAHGRKAINELYPGTNMTAVAKIFGISDKSVRRLIARNLIRPSKALRHLLIPKKEIERFLDDT